MAEISDDEITTTMDYLGRKQPLGDRRVGLATGTPAAGGGAGVTASAMPSVGQRAQAVHDIMAGGGGLSEAQRIIGGLSTAKGFAEKVAKVREMFPSETVRGEVAGEQTPFQFINGQAVGTDPGAFTPVPAGAFDSFTPVPGGALPAFTPATDVGAAGFEAAEAAQSGASAGAAGAAGSGVAGAAGEAVPYLSAAYNIASKAAAGQVPADEQAVDAAGQIVAAYFAPVTFGASVIAEKAWEKDVHRQLTSLKEGDVGKALLGSLNEPQHMADLIGTLGDLVSGDLFGEHMAPHSVREALDMQKHIGPQATAFQQEIQRAKSPADLWNTLVAHESGSVGGTSPMAVSISLPESGEHLKEAVAAGDVALPAKYGSDIDAFLRDHQGTVSVGPGNANASYPVFTQQGFYKALRADPQGLKAGVQAGVSQDRLSPMNKALAHTILRQYAGLYQPPVQAPLPMPTRGVDAGGPENKIVNPPPGPSGALGFANDVLQDPTAGP